MTGREVSIRQTMDKEVSVRQTMDRKVSVRHNGQGG